MLFSSGGCDGAIAATCCVAWGKFRKLLPVLTTRHLSAKICGKVYEACIRSSVLHGSKTLEPKAIDLQRLHHNDHAMVHWICDAKDRNETPSASLLRKFCIEDITAVFRNQRLMCCRWLGPEGLRFTEI